MFVAASGVWAAGEFRLPARGGRRGGGSWRGQQRRVHGRRLTLRVSVGRRLLLRERPPHHDRPRVRPDGMLLSVRLGQARAQFLPSRRGLRRPLPLHRPEPLP